MAKMKTELAKAGSRGTVSALALGTCAAALMSFAAPAAIAQDAIADTPQATTETSRRLNAVQVTATRREGATVQDVPVAVTVISPELFEDSGFNALGDLEQLAPSIGITQTESSASGTSISIRGIGTGSNNPGFEPAVGIFIDGVYRTRTGIALSDTPEFAGIEVLRGPQGTLFGRNTSAGVVSIETAGPKAEAEKQIYVGATSFDGYYVGGHITGATAENWAARIDAKYRTREGYINDINTGEDFNDVDRYFINGQLAYEGDNSDLRIIVDTSHADENCCTAVNIAAGPLAAAVNTGAGLAGLIGLPANNPEAYQVAISPGRDYQEDVDQWGVSTEYNRRINDMNFTSITAYREWEATRNQDVDFSGIDRAYRDGTRIEDTTFTQEFRLQGDYGRVNWLVGAFFLDQELGYDDTIRFGSQADLYTDLVTAGAVGAQLFGTLPFAFTPTGTAGTPPALGIVRNPVTGAPIINPATGTPIPIFLPGTPEGAGQQSDSYTVETTALALFTHNEIAITDQLTATLGGRYNYEEKELSADLVSVVPACDFLAANPAIVGALGALSGLVCNPAVNTEFNGTYADTREENEFTGTAKLAYAFNSDLNVYAGYSRGFKSGGYNLDRSGFDSVLFGGDGPQTDDLEFEGETVDAYELGVKSSLLDGMMTVNGALFFSDVKNFQENFFTGINFRTFNVDVESYGLEVDVAANPTDNLTLQGGFIYNVAERKSDVSVPTGTGGILLIAEEGVQLTNTPEYALTASGTYTYPISDAVELLFHANARYNDEVFTSPAPGQRDLTANDSYLLLGARVGVRDPDGLWELSVFGENITDEYYNLSSFGVPEQTGNIAVYPAFPQLFGVEAKVNF